MGTGWGIVEGVKVGSSRGTDVGAGSGDCVGDIVSNDKGGSEGTAVGLSMGGPVAVFDGVGVACVGAGVNDGLRIGTDEVSRVLTEVGGDEGAYNGSAVGKAAGEVVGTLVIISTFRNALNALGLSP